MPVGPTSLIPVKLTVCGRKKKMTASNLLLVTNPLVKSTIQASHSDSILGFGAANMTFSCVAYFLVENKEPEKTATKTADTGENKDDGSASKQANRR